MPKNNYCKEHKCMTYSCRQCVAEPLQDDIERLVKHAAYLGRDLVDGGDCVDSSNESWRALPQHIMDAINAETERQEAEDKHIDEVIDAEQSGEL